MTWRTFQSSKLGKLALFPGNDGETGQTRAERDASSSLLALCQNGNEIQPKSNKQAGIFCWFVFNSFNFHLHK